MPLIRQSVIVALVASIVTAVLFQMLFTNSGASRELLEGSHHADCGGDVVLHELLAALKSGGPALESPGWRASCPTR